MDNLFEGITPTSEISNPLGGGGTNPKPVNQGDVFPPSAFSPNRASTNQPSGFGDNGFGGGFGGGFGDSGFGDNGFGGGSGFSSVSKPQPTSRPTTNSTPPPTTTPSSATTVTPRPSGIKMNGGATAPPPKTQSTVPGKAPQPTSQVPQNAQAPQPQSTTTPRPYTTEEINASRERAVRKFSSIILGGLEYIPLVLGNINQITFVTYLELLTLGLFAIQLFANYVLALSNKIPMFITMILLPVNTLIFLFVRYYHVIQQKRLERAQELASLEQNETYFSESDIQQEPELKSESSATSSFQPKFTTPEPMYTPAEFHSFEVTPQSEQEEKVVESNEETVPLSQPQPQPLITPVQFQDVIPDETPSTEHGDIWKPMQSPRTHSTPQPTEPTEPTEPQQEITTPVAQEEPQQSTSNEFGTQSFGFGGNFLSDGFNTGFGQVTPFEAIPTEPTTAPNKPIPPSEPVESIRETQTLTTASNIEHQDTQPIVMLSFEEYTPKEVDLTGTVNTNEQELLEADSLTEANDRLSSLSQDITNLLDSLRL